MSILTITEHHRDWTENSGSGSGDDMDSGAIGVSIYYNAIGESLLLACRAFLESKRSYTNQNIVNFIHYFRKSYQ